MSSDPLRRLRLLQGSLEPNLEAADRLADEMVEGNEGLKQALRLMRAFHGLKDNDVREKAIAFVEGLSGHKSKDSG